jgi:hypothetical protein
MMTGMKRALLCYAIMSALVGLFFVLGRGREWANYHPELRDGQKDWY